MELEKFVWTESEMPQGSDAWFKFREGRLGSSEVSTLMHLNPWDDIRSLWRRRVGLEVKDRTEGMQRGNDMEPVARELYERTTGNKVEPLVLLHPKYPWMHSSLDGISEDKSVLVEIKTAKTKDNWKRFTKDGKVPDFRLPQIQQQLGVANALFGTKTAHYWCYFDEENYGYEGKPIEVTFDPDYFKELCRRMDIFLNTFVKKQVEPPPYLFKAEEPLYRRNTNH